MISISNVLLESESLSFSASGNFFFSINKKDVVNFDIQPMLSSKNWVVMYHGLRFELDAISAQNLIKHLNLLSENE